MMQKYRQTIMAKWQPISNENIKENNNVHRDKQ